MPYVNPATLFQDSFNPTVRKILPIIPALLAADREKKAVAEAQYRSNLLQPRVDAQTRLANAEADRAEMANRIYSKIMGGEGNFEGHGITQDEAYRKIGGFSPPRQANQPAYMDAQMVSGLKQKLNREPTAQEIVAEKQRLGLEAAEGKRNVIVNNPIPMQPPQPPKATYEEDLLVNALRQKLGREPTDAEKSKAIQDYKITLSSASGQSRAAAFGDIRQITVLDTKNNNDMITMTAGQFNELSKQEPGRYLDATKAQKALTQSALLQDIHGAINNARGSVSRLQTDFDEKNRLILYKAVTSANPTGAINNLIGGEFGKALSMDQIDYLTDLNQLIENAMAMRAVLGAGQGSDQLRDAIKATVPNKGTFSKAYAMSQLDKFDQQVNRLERGVPGVTLAPAKGPIESQGKQPSTHGLPGGWKQFDNQPTQSGASKEMTPEIAGKYLQQNGGNRKAAEDAARRDGYTW